MTRVLISSFLLLSFSALSCPQFNLKNVTCTYSDNSKVHLEEISVIGNILSFQTKGIKKGNKLPYKSTNKTTSITYCNGDVIVVDQILNSESVTKTMTYSESERTLIVQGEEIEPRCDYPEGCAEGIYTVNRIKEVNFECK